MSRAVHSHTPSCTRVAWLKHGSAINACVATRLPYGTFTKSLQSLTCKPGISPRCLLKICFWLTSYFCSTLASKSPARNANHFGTNRKYQEVSYFLGHQLCLLSCKENQRRGSFNSVQVCFHFAVHGCGHLHVRKTRFFLAHIYTVIRVGE